jgi:hypothetical protein
MQGEQLMWRAMPRASTNAFADMLRIDLPAPRYSNDEGQLVQMSAFAQQLQAARGHQAKVASTWMVSVGRDEPTEQQLKALRDQMTDERRKFDQQQEDHAAKLEKSVMLSTGAVCMRKPNSCEDGDQTSRIATPPAAVNTLAKRSFMRARFTTAIRTVIFRSGARCHMPAILQQ